MRVEEVVGYILLGACVLVYLSAVAYGVWIIGWANDEDLFEGLEE